MPVVGRRGEALQLEQALKAGANVLIEGPVGVGKTYLVSEVLSKLKRTYERVDGDTRYTEQKLTGWFDPPLVLKKGYSKDTFIPGPLVVAMKQGLVLFINELNRMPEAVQNILLPAMDERRITLPKLGEVRAKAGFSVIATQNPREFTATHALSEALLDRFEMIRLGYQSETEEREILVGAAGTKSKTLVSNVLSLVRATRTHASVKRGASVRAGLAVLRLVDAGADFREACFMALPTRMEMISSDEDPRELIEALLTQGNFDDVPEKKKTLRK